MLLYPSVLCVSMFIGEDPRGRSYAPGIIPRLHGFCFRLRAEDGASGVICATSTLTTACATTGLSFLLLLLLCDVTVVVGVDAQQECQKNVGA